MNQLTYIPGTVGADAIGLDGGGSFVGIASNLRSRAWAYKLGYRDIETANRPAREVSLDFETDYATADAFRRAADADVLARTPGMFLAQGEWRQRGYITSAEPSYIHYGRLGVKLGCILLEGAWWRVRSQSFAAENTVIEDRYESATGEQVVTVGADSAPLHSLIVEGKSVQDGTPTPSNPVDVQTVGGINLFPATLTNGGTAIYSGQATVTLQDGLFTMTATGTDISFGYATYSAGTAHTNSQGVLVPVIANEKYTLLCTNSDFNKLFITWYDASKLTISTTPTSSSNYITGTAPSNATYAIIRFGKGNATVGTSYSTYVQFEHGAAAQPYVPYGALGLHVHSNNLLKPRPRPATVVSGITYTAHDDGSISISGTATADADWVISDANINKIIVAAGTYSFSAVGLAGGVKFIVNGGGFNGFPYKEMTSATQTATGAVTDGTKSFNYIILRVANGTTVNTTVYPQLNAGAVPLPYDSYYSTVTPIPLDGNVLASLPDGTKDTLTVDPTGHVTLTKNTGVIDLGVQTWSWQSTWLSWYTDYLDLNFRPTTSNAEIPSIYSDSLVGANLNTITNAATAATNLICVSVNLTSPRLISKNGSTETAPSGMLYYPLATPTTVDLGYIEMPDVFDGAVVDVIAEVTPTITAEWKLANVVYLDYPHDYQYDYMKSSNNTEITTSVLTPSDVRITIFGAVSNPYIIVGDNRYQVNVTVPAGGYLEIDGRKKTIMLTLADGTQQNVFGAGVRGSGMGGGEYIFEPIKGGAQQVQWSGAFGFDLAWYEDEGEPPWSR